MDIDVDIWPDDDGIDLGPPEDSHLREPVLIGDMDTQIFVQPVDSQQKGRMNMIIIRERLALEVSMTVEEATELAEKISTFLAAHNLKMGDI